MKCFYHNDLDGRCAGAVVAHHEEGNHNKFYEVDYVKPLPINEIEDYESIYFVDYSFKESTLNQLYQILEKTPNVVWCDHHTSSLNLIKQHPQLNQIYGLRNEGISGAALTYMYLYVCELNECPMFIQLVSDYDCWLYKFGDITKYFKLGMDTVPNDALDPIWKSLFRGSFRDSELCVKNLIEAGRCIKNYLDNDNKYHFDHFGYKSKFEGLDCLVINRESNSWIFGDKINDVPLVVVFVFNGEQYVYSLFSTNPNIDCCRLAELYGGGGHRGAAGFSSKELLFKK
jgi:oligoribonuclease NrnB/cAMP/cGMP phosphodiesterase (DHH superfamily)